MWNTCGKLVVVDQQYDDKNQLMGSTRMRQSWKSWGVKLREC